MEQGARRGDGLAELESTDGLIARTKSVSESRMPTAGISMIEAGEHQTDADRWSKHDQTLGSLHEVRLVKLKTSAIVGNLRALTSHGDEVGKGCQDTDAGGGVLFIAKSGDERTFTNAQSESQGREITCFSEELVWPTGDA